MTNNRRSTFHINETWFAGWNPLRDEYGYPINTAMPPGFYIEHGRSVIKRWYPETGMWNHFMDLTRMSPDTFREVIFCMPPELPFEALDHDTKKSVRKSRSQGRIKRHLAPLPATVDPTGDARRRRERNAIFSRRFGFAVLQIGGALAAVALLVRLLMG